MTSVADRPTSALLHAGKKCSTITALDPGRLEKLGQISQKTKLTAAIPYTLSRWEAPLAHPGRGHIKIDSNVVERSIQPITQLFLQLRRWRRALGSHRVAG
ncbi:MAG: hypothetical protein E5X51_34340 [Mesorhizobium sp.]|uniref:IS66 family transposase n=1 Tax=Mesorhizobium sp. TaxID=1871066 RepID=UPI00121D2207|nr:MAG: hypothetical protein E5X51_34340 [Mesorhizobium sp.]